MGTLSSEDDQSLDLSPGPTQAGLRRPAPSHTVPPSNMTKMSDWNQLVTEFYKIDHADEPDSLVLGAPASDEVLDALASNLGFALPIEFRSFYGTYDGFGTKHDDGTTDWFFAPTANIPELTEEIRDWYQETHPEIAARFVSFVDWGNGDSSGYLFSEAGAPLDGVYIFEHESYEFEEGQDWGEFLIPVDKSIRDFLAE